MGKKRRGKGRKERGRKRERGREREKEREVYTWRNREAVLLEENRMHREHSNGMEQDF